MPHITNKIHEWIERVAHVLVDNAGRHHWEARHRRRRRPAAGTPPPRRRGRLLRRIGQEGGGGDVVVVKVVDVCLIKVGGTVGDIQSSMFLEALCQSQFRVISGAYYRWQKLLASSFCTWNLLDISLPRNQVVFFTSLSPNSILSARSALSHR